MTNFADVLIWFLTLVALGVYFVRFGLSHLYDYVIGEEGVEFCFLSAFRILTIRFDLICDVFEGRLFTSVDSQAWSIFRGIMIGNRLATRFVVLKLKSEFIRYVGLTPADRKIFMEQIRAKLKQNSGESAD